VNIRHDPQHRRKQVKAGSSALKSTRQMRSLFEIKLNHSAPNWSNCRTATCFTMLKSILPSICFFLLQNLSAQATWYATGQNADLMVSGVDFNNSGSNLYFNHPNGLATDGTHFLVCDRFNNRILVWNTLPNSSNTAPDLVLGQPNFVSNNPGTSKNQLNWAGNASLSAQGQLAVADTENDRILLWNHFPTDNGQPADVSLFLPGMTLPGAPMLYGWPWGVWTDGNRVASLIWLQA